MARLLIYTISGPGHVYPPVATALALRDRGHEVAFRADDEWLEMLRSLGFSASPTDPRLAGIVLEDWKARTPIGAIRAAVATFDARARYEIPDLQAAIEDERPDLIWVDLNAPGAAVAAEASGLPWAHFLPFPYPWPAPGVPSFGPGFAPSTSRRARLRDTGMTAFSELFFRSFVREQNARRTSLGLPALGRAEDFSLIAPLQILFSAEPFEYPREWPQNVQLVGPALWEPPAAEPEWLAEEERPLIMVTASTLFQDDAKLIRQTLEAFADRPYAVVATTAAHDPDDFAIPANARVERHLPHAPILRRAAVVVSHGGMGTTQKALAAGVPVCVVPFIRDQLEVARRTEQCGGGTILRPGRLRPDRLRGAVEEAIERRAGAERVAEAFAQAGGADAAASALEGLLKVPA
jgi:MGT family glycosyltransferase